MNQVFAEDILEDSDIFNLFNESNRGEIIYHLTTLKNTMNELKLNIYRDCLKRLLIDYLKKYDIFIFDLNFCITNPELNQLFEKYNLLDELDEQLKILVLKKLTKPELDVFHRDLKILKSEIKISIEDLATMDIIPSKYKNEAKILARYYDENIKKYHQNMLDNFINEITFEDIQTMNKILASEIPKEMKDKYLQCLETKLKILNKFVIGGK
jgi:hypothetical protein